MQLIDTHCHIHETNYPLDIGDVMRRAHESGVGRMICVGTNEANSEEAIAFTANHKDIYAAVGVHPHDTKDGYGRIAKLAKDHKSTLVAVGEIGLDYFYTHSPREIQIAALEAQLQTALDNSLPVIFHVREAFDDFWPIFDNFSGLRGVMHSFTDSKENLEIALSKGLYIGVNGISVFTKDGIQREMFDAIPLENILLETDAPFLTPPPYRGKVNEPAYVKVVAQHHADRRRIPLEEIATRSSANATSLFAL
jgi:TatD DNase family protein